MAAHNRKKEFVQRKSERRASAPGEARALYFERRCEELARRCEGLERAMKVMQNSRMQELEAAKQERRSVVRLSTRDVMLRWTGAAIGVAVLANVLQSSWR